MSVDHLVGPAVRGAIQTLLWVGTRYDSTAEVPESEAEDLRILGPLPGDLEAEVRQDVEDFILANAADLLEYVARRRPDAVAEYDGQTSADWAAECIGHDFILTRNHHGAGFWDRGLGDLGDRLTTAAHVYGEQSIEADERNSLSILG